MLTVYGIETATYIVAPSTTVAVATVLTVYGIETFNSVKLIPVKSFCCNSAYRLRY